jgi:hypothetical protein
MWAALWLKNLVKLKQIASANIGQATKKLNQLLLCGCGHNCKQYKNA